jgi:hypothetical protein
MSAERYPSNLVVTAQDFAGCGWKNVLTGTTREGYSSMWQAFSAAARQAMEEGRQSHGKVLWLLADACSMMLSPKSINEPFKPFMVMDGQRSVIPEDLPEADISFYAQIVDGNDDPWLKARLADLIWLKQRPRDVKYALAAIDSYRTIPLDTKTWIRGGDKCWERAISLARMLKDGAGERLKEIETAIVTVCCASTRQDGFLGLWLANLLNESGLARDQTTTIAQRLESLAREFENEGELHRAREYFNAAAQWYKRAGDEAKTAEMTVSVAEGWVKEAVARVSSDKPSHMVAASFYENAIQTYRTIPRSERAAHRVDERIEELRRHLNESGEKSLDEMGVIKSPGVDISKIVENARNAVRGKDAIEALKAFANLHGGVNAKEARESAIEKMRQHPLQTMFPATVMSRDGRVIARRPGISLGSTLTDEDEVVIQSEMIHDFGILVSIVVQGDIWPALEVLLVEHRLTEADFIQLARQSPIVPKGREQLFGKALFAGYERDFVTALHLLVPQIEHMVRYHLKQAGVKTTTLSIDGIENENGLSTLIELPEVNRVFGEDLAFEIRALFCDPFGSNLRNELAHGLLDDEACYSIHSIYAWWFALRLVFNTYWNAARKKPESGGEDKMT